LRTRFPALLVDAALHKKAAAAYEHRLAINIGLHAEPA
jgi:hypothetical protein